MRSFARAGQSGPTKVSTRQKKKYLSTYSEPPSLELNIDQFESLALSRLNVLRWIEKQRGLGKPLLRPNRKFVSEKESKDTYLEDILKENGLNNIENDTISHFIARMGYCQTEERRRWFLTQEIALFQARYTTAHADDKIRIHSELCGAESHYETLSKQDLMKQDVVGRAPIPPYTLERVMEDEAKSFPYHKVPFQEVLRLVATRKVLMCAGYAFVPNFMFSTLIVGKFRTLLSKGLASARLALDRMRHDPIAMNEASRILHIILGLHKISSGPAYKSVAIAGEVKPHMIRDLSKLHFPLCQQNSHDHLMKDKHIKHGTRMEFGLFLKGIGLSLPDAMKYMKTNMTSKTNDFEKQFSYNIRHMYGKEGKRIDYTPYSCSKIISAHPNMDDHHGCPFKLFDTPNLQRFLQHKNVPQTDVKEIIALKDAQHYQLACRKMFEVQNRGKLREHKYSIDDIESTWSHPNEYFDLSYSLHHPDIMDKRQKAMEQTEQDSTQQSGGRKRFRGGFRRRSTMGDSGSATPAGGTQQQQSSGGKDEFAMHGLTQEDLEAAVAMDLEDVLDAGATPAVVSTAENDSNVKADKMEVD